jgi:hypothetical protein
VRTSKPFGELQVRLEFHALLANGRNMIEKKSRRAERGAPEGFKN